GLGLQLPVASGRAGMTIIDERHVVADEHFVLDRHAFADEGVARDLAGAADLRALLYLNERPDLGVVTDLTTVKVGEIVDLDVLAEFYVRRDALKRLCLTHKTTVLTPVDGQFGRARGFSFRTDAGMAVAVAVPISIAVSVANSRGIERH